jgi:dethiobiotin synthetase
MRPRSDRMTRGIFITATDTGVGKTFIAAALLRGFAAAGLRAVGMKPVAAGIDPGAALNPDVSALMAAGNVVAPTMDTNPYAFAPAIAPHLAAAAAGVSIDLERIAAAYARMAAAADVVVVEGAGGVLVPLGARIDMLDIPRRLDLPVLLVVGIRLGCLNHARLSALAISARGLRFAGWIANRIDPSMPEADANVAALAGQLPASLIADVRWQPGVAATIHPRALAALHLDPRTPQRS